MQRNAIHTTAIVLTIAAAASLAAFAPIGGARAQQGVPADVLKELAPTGKLRAGINTGNSVLAQRSASGEFSGISVDLARELAKRLGVPVELNEFKAAGESVAAMAKGNLDVAFFAIEPKRAAEVTFSPPYAVIDGAYMVAKDSPLQTPADVDRPGIRVGVGLGSAYDLFLTRTLKNATIIRATTGGGQATIDLFYSAKPDAAAGVRQPLEEYAKTDPKVRVMKEPFMAIQQAMGVTPGRPAAARYVRDFIEEVKKNGFVAAGLKRSNQSPDLVAPPATN
jgi:polar amino acid transport system substrate-binding protein